MEAIIYGEQLSLAKEGAELQHEQIRQQQVALRLQQNQNEIGRMMQLRKVLAEEQVQLGVRGISAQSGTIKAITEQNLQAYIMDENADKLNFMTKQQSINIQDAMVDLNKRAQYLAATAGFIKNIENIVMTVGTAGAGGGGAGGAAASGGAMAASRNKGASNMFDASGSGYNMNLNG